MATEPSADTRAEMFELELYKILKTESASYYDRLQSLWLQKFVLVGSVIAFLVTNHDKLKIEGSSIVVSSAIFAVPVLSALLDAKILEFSLHARSISRFIEAHFLTPPTVSQWEKVLWGLEGLPEDRSIARIRHLTTALITVVPTSVIWLLASIAVGQLMEERTMWFSLGVLGCVVQALVTWLSWRVMWAGTRKP